MAIIFSNFIGLMSSMLHTKPYAHWPFGSTERDFKGFLPYMGWLSSWSCDLDTANKLLSPLPIEAPFGFDWPSGF